MNAGLPEAWPSAWPSLWRPVRDRAVLVGAMVVLTLVGLARFGDLGLSWWVALLPLVLLAGPVSRPARVRGAIRRAAADRTLRVRTTESGLWVTARRRSVAAMVSADGSVRYQAGRSPGR